jgi:bifunctional non-homologous end joining protein LigD
LKHDGYRLQIHVRDGRIRLYTINGADWSKRYPLIVRDIVAEPLLATADQRLVLGHAGFYARARFLDTRAEPPFFLLVLDCRAARFLRFSSGCETVFAAIC